MRTVFVSLCLAGGLYAQSVGTLGPDPSIVRLGDSTYLTLRIDGHPDAELGPLPVSPEFQLVAEPRRRIEFETLRDGVVTPGRAASWRIALRPLQAGRLAVPSFVVVVDGHAVGSAGDLTVDVVRDESGVDRAFVEWEVDRTELFHGESLRATLRFGIRDSLLDRGIVPLFRQPLDLPMDLRSFWIEQHLDSLRFERVERTVSIALNGSTCRVGRAGIVERDGRRFASFELPFEFAPQDSGEHLLTPPLLRFAFATEFEDSLFEPVPRDRHEAIVYGEPARFTIQPLPGSGRPTSFRGAVGAFRVTAVIEDLPTRVGETFFLDLRIDGPGNHATLGTPDPVLPGFHVYGHVVARGTDSTRVRYEIAALERTRSVPPIEFSFFDPATRGYRNARTEPIPLDIAGDTVRERDPTARGELRGLMPVDAASRVPRSRHLSWWILAMAILVPLLVRSGLRALVRRSEADRVDPRRRAARRARREFRRALRRQDRPLRQAVLEYVGARLHRDPPGVVGADVAAELRRGGADPETSQELAELVRAIVDADYGGEPTRPEPRRLRQLVDRVDASFRSGLRATALVIAVAFTSPLVGQDPAENAIRDYAAGRFERARAEFHAAIESAAPRSLGPLLYDAGNAAFQTGRHAEARW
ncbi:MAG: BatD family protein, partial [Planctomycetes bacterium]|nr:BatD family protein [Planctomycetota bacterium]